MSHPAQDYRADIDGMRAIAILLVAVFHFKLFDLGEAGFIGVDVFFVISGFLITRILVGRLNEGRLSLGSFYLARLRRLMPALVATLVLYLVVASFVFLPDRFAELSIEALLSQLYVVNIYFWRTINYFGLRADNVPLLHMWSLAIEEQFYIFYPLLLALIFRFARSLLLPVLILGCVASFALGWFASGWKPEAAFYLLPTRAWELLAGGILAVAFPRGLKAGPVASLLGPLGLVLIVVAIVIHTPVTQVPGWYAALPVLASAFLLLGGPETPVGRVLALSPMVWIGKISYPLYLVHWPIIILQREVLQDYALIWRWAGFFFAIVLAWAIWRFVEDPIRRGRVLPTARQFLLGAGLTTAVLLAVSLAGTLTKGFPNRFAPEVQALLAYGDDQPWDLMACEVSKRNPRPCPLGAETEPASVMVIGDSHSLAMGGALDLWLEDIGRGGALWFHHGCLPTLGAGDANCLDFLDRAMVAAADDSVETILLISSWRHAPGIFEGLFLEAAEADAGLTRALDATLEKLTALGKRVILVDPIFYASNPVPTALARNLHFGTDLAVDRPYSEYLAQNETLFGIFDAAIATHGVARVSIVQDLCQGGTCRAIYDDAPVFTDNSHVRFGMSPYFAGVFKDLRLFD